LREACATIGAGITSADYGRPTPARWSCFPSAREARMISLLPPMHGLIPREIILTGLDELFTILPNPAEVTSSMVLITGPSRTADIEQILVRGVHGTGEIHVIVV
jgi:L-lactate dehydrogenase complex protein LldG